MQYQLITTARINELHDIVYLLLAYSLPIRSRDPQGCSSQLSNARHSILYVAFVPRLCTAFLSMQSFARTE